MRYNGNKFSVYESEEKTVLGLLDELGSQVNHNTDNLKIKTDLYGDHKGSWQGIERPERVEGGIDAVVIDHTEKINFLTQLKAKFIFGIKGNGTDETEKIQSYLDSLQSGDVAYFPKGNYAFTRLVLKDKPNITIMGQTEIGDYVGGRNATKFTVLSSSNGGITLDGCVGSVLKNIELTYHNYTKTQVDHNGIGLWLEGSPQTKVENCIIHGFDTAINMHSLGVLQIKNNRLFNCNNGIIGKECGDSIYENNYIYDIAMDKPQQWLEENADKGCAICLAYAGNSIISGGKIEWNGKGINLMDTHGVTISNINFDYNRGYAILTKRTNNDYLYDTNRPYVHVQRYYKYSSYDNKIMGCTFNGNGHFGNADTHYGSDIVLYYSSDTTITGNTFSYGSYQSYANEYGDNPLYETGGEEIRKKSGPKVSFVKVINSPNIIVVGNSFNSHYVRPSVQIVDSGVQVSSVQYAGNNSGICSPVSNLTRSQFYQIDSVGRKIINLDNAPSETRGSYNYMDSCIYFDGSKLKTVYCTKGGTIKPLNDLYVSNDVNTLDSLYCQNRDITEQDLLVGDHITVGSEEVIVTGFYKNLSEGNHWIKINKKLSSPVNGVKIELTYPLFTS